MENNFNADPNLFDYVKMKDGSYKSRKDLINDSNTVKVNQNQGVVGTAIDQLGNDFGTLGGGLLGLAGNDSAMKRAESNMLANQYIDSQKDYGTFSGSGLLNLGIRQLPMMIGTFGTGAIAKRGAQSLVENLLEKKMTEQLANRAFTTGLGVAGGLQNVGFENAQNYANTGKQLTGGQALTDFGTGAVLNAVEGNALLGKFGQMSNLSQPGLNLATRGGNALKTGISAGAINTTQDILNRGVAGRDLTSADALHGYGEQFATGGLIGGLFGGLHSRKVTPDIATTPETTKTDTQQESVSQVLPQEQQNVNVNPNNTANAPLLLGHNPDVRNVLYGTDTGILGENINQVSDQRLKDLYSPQEVKQSNLQQNSILQLGYNPDIVNNAKESNVLYGTDTGILGKDINQVSDQRLMDYLNSGKNETISIDGFQEVKNDNTQPQKQLGYNPDAGRPVMYASDTGTVGTDINKVADQRLKDLYSPQEIKKVNESPKSREELLKRLQEKQNFKDNSVIDSNPIDTTISNDVNVETPKKSINPGLQKLIKDKINKNTIELMKQQEALKNGNNPKFEEDIRIITGDNSLFKDGNFNLTNKNLSKPIEVAIKGHANDIRSGEVIAKTEANTNPIVLDNNTKNIATNKIKNPKVKNEFIKLNEQILENPSIEKISLLNNVKNELEVSNASDSSKLLNTISKVADNLTEKTAKNINDSFSNKQIDQAYIDDIMKMAEQRRNENNIKIDQVKQEQFNKLISSENDNFKTYDNALMQSTPIEKDGVLTYSMKDGNSTIEKIVDKNSDTTQYLRDGQLHNEFGPALIEGKTKEYYLFDENLSKKEWRDQLNQINDSRPQIESLKKNDNVRLKSNILTNYLKDLISNNRLSDAVELKKQNIVLSDKEQAKIDSLNKSLNDVRKKVNVDIEVISPLHSINPEDGSQVYGWFDSEKNKIYIVGTENIKETMATILRHELYHKGISVYLKGTEKEVFHKELDRLYENKLIKEMTDKIKTEKGYDDKYIAIEEALAEIVQDEKNIIQNPSMFNRIFDYFKSFLNKILGTNSFETNKEVRDFLNKTQKLALKEEELQPIRQNIENVIRFSKGILPNDATKKSFEDEFRNKKFETQMERNDKNIVGKMFDDAKNEFTREQDTNLNPYANPLGTNLFKNKFNNSFNSLLQGFLKQDALLSFHGKVGQSIINVINSINTLKGDASARFENESSKLLKIADLFSLDDHKKIFNVVGKYANEIQNDTDLRSIGQRINETTLINELKQQGFSGKKLNDAVSFAKEIRNVADYVIHISKMNDSIGVIETIKKTLNGYDELLGDKIDSIISQSFRNEFEKYGTKLGNDTLSIRNFNENYEKILNDSKIRDILQQKIDEQTKAINEERNAKLSVDVSNMTKQEYEKLVNDANALAESKINEIVEKQHLDNINSISNKLKEFQDEANFREERGYIHKDVSGDYFLTVKMSIKEKNGEVKEFNYTLGSNSKNEISSMYSDLKNKYGDMIQINTGTRSSINQRDLVNSLLNLEAYGDGVLTTEQTNLMAILQGYGDKIERRYSGPGYELNMIKTLSDYGFNKINQIANKHKTADISILLNSIDGPNKASIKSQITDILQTMSDNKNIPQDTVGSKIRGVTSIWALGANLSNTVAQIFQTGMIAPNYFSKFTNDTTWLTSLQDATRFLSEKTSGNKDLDSLISRIENNNLLTSSMTKSMFEVKENPFGKTKFDKVKEKAYFLNEFTEKRLRYATAMESFKIYKAEEVKRSQGKEFNKEILDQTIDNFVLNNIRIVNGDFSKQNRAKIYQNDLIATLMMFQDWKAVTFNAFRNMNRESQIKFALQHSVLMGGILGVPFADDIVELTDAFFKFFGVQPPVRRHVEKFANTLDNYIMQGAGDWFKHGIPFIGEKIGLGQIIPNLSGAIELTTGDKEKGLKGLIGPSGQLITNMAGGLKQVGSGIGEIATSGGSRGYETLGRGFINMSPGVLKSFEKGLEVGLTGQLQSADGSVKMYDVNRINSLLIAGNFRTPGMADTIDEYNVLKEYKTVQDTKMKQLRSAYLDAYHSKDFKEMANIDMLAKSINPSFNGKDIIKNDKSSISMKDRFIKSIPKDTQSDYKKLL